MCEAFLTITSHKPKFGNSIDGMDEKPKMVAINRTAGSQGMSAFFIITTEV